MHRIAFNISALCSLLYYTIEGIAYLTIGVIFSKCDSIFASFATCQDFHQGAIGLFVALAPIVMHMLTSFFMMWKSSTAMNRLQSSIPVCKCDYR